MSKFLEIPIFSLLVNAEQLELVKMMADLTDLITQGRVGRSTRIWLRTKSSSDSMNFTLSDPQTMV